MNLRSGHDKRTDRICLHLQDRTKQNCQSEGPDRASQEGPRFTLSTPFRPGYFHLQDTHLPEVILQVNRGAWQSRKGKTTPNSPHNKMCAAEPGTGVGRVEQEEPETEFLEVCNNLKRPCQGEAEL